MPRPVDSIQETGELVLSAIGSDDILVDHLILKGGNALQLVHHVGGRASKDFDFSLSGEPDRPTIESRLRTAIEERFRREGFIAFDFTFEERPAVKRPGAPAGEVWGGYRATFKYLSLTVHEQLRGRIASRVRRKEVLTGLPLPPVSPDDNEGLFFSRRSAAGTPVILDLSRNEFIDGATEAELRGFTIRVYTLPMIVSEKLRALCQQMEGYPRRRGQRTPRARDLYDIHAVCAAKGFDPVDRSHRALLDAMFAVKEVPTALLLHLGEERDFLKTAWPSVVATIPGGSVQEFDFYFEFVIALVAELNRQIPFG